MLDVLNYPGIPGIFLAVIFSGALRLVFVFVFSDMFNDRSLGQKVQIMNIHVHSKIGNILKTQTKNLINHSIKVRNSIGLKL